MPEDRWAAEVQPDPVYYPSLRANYQWMASAILFARGTGKAHASVSVKKQKIVASTREEVLLLRQELIARFVSPVKRCRKGSRSPQLCFENPSPPVLVNQDDVENLPCNPLPAHSNGQFLDRQNRSARPASLAEPKGNQGPQYSGMARAGPGRGKKYESAKPLLQQLIFPQEEVVSTLRIGKEKRSLHEKKMF